MGLDDTVMNIKIFRHDTCPRRPNPNSPRVAVGQAYGSAKKCSGEVLVCKAAE